MKITATLASAQEPILAPQAIPKAAYRLTGSHSTVKLRAFIAGIAQLVEHNLAKVGVASSNLVSRSIIPFLFSIT